VRRPVTGLLLTLLLLPAATAAGQEMAQRGFVEGQLSLFPQKASNDSTRTIGDALVREEVFLKAARWVQFAGGVDLRAGSHEQVEDRWRLDVSDRGLQRPRASVRRLSATLTRGWLTLDIGKQFIRWGKTDIVTPTDWFAPRDFLAVVDNDFLAVAGVRGVVQRRADTLELVWVPRFTPSRMPLAGDRWTAIPPQAAGIPIVSQSPVLPGSAQTGVRWGHVSARFEHSVSFFHGFSHLPNINARAGPPVTEAAGPFEVDVTRSYPALRAYGADAAVPMRWFTVKGEAGYLTSKTPGADEYLLYVMQLERQAGEWLLVGGYAGEIVTRRRAALTFAPDRGLARSVVGRASCTIDPNRTVAFEGAVRQNGRGAWAKAEYSQARGAHWRATVAGALLRGDPNDFLGQYRRNSHARLVLRYSF
jgi:hypothetical protein